MPDGPYRIESPSLLPNGEKYEGTETYTLAELKAKDYDELRQMAAEVEDNAVNGKSTKMEIISYFRNHATLEDF